LSVASRSFKDTTGTSTFSGAAGVVNEAQSSVKVASHVVLEPVGVTRLFALTIELERHAASLVLKAVGVDEENTWL